MVKATVKYNGAHKWAQHKFLMPLDFKFIFFRGFELLWVFITTSYIMYLLSFAVLYSELKKTLIIMAVVDFVMIKGFISSLIKKVKEKKAILSDDSDKFSRDFTIDESGIFLNYSSDEEWGSSEISFDGVCAASETAEYFVFCIDRKKRNQRVYSIGKADLTEGTSEELSALFQDKLGGRFRRRAK